jgi:hypothetical protein
MAGRGAAGAPVRILQGAMRTQRPHAVRLGGREAVCTAARGARRQPRAPALRGIALGAAATSSLLPAGSRPRPSTRGVREDRMLRSDTWSRVSCSHRDSMPRLCDMTPPWLFPLHRLLPPPGTLKSSGHRGGREQVS